MYFWMQVDVCCVPEFVHLGLKGFIYATKGMKVDDWRCCENENWHLRMAMPDRDSHYPAKHIQIAFAFVIVQPLHLARVDQEGLTIECGQGRV